jgi:cytoplasmic FMR1 interacting protein
VLQLQSSRYATLMAQRHIQLLGRTIDMSQLISQHVNGYLRRNLDYVIRKFESSDLSSIVELQYHLQNVKMTHELLSEHLNLDPFDEMFKELNDDNALGQFRGRIVFHVFSELLSDLLPNFNYNSATRR